MNNRSINQADMVALLRLSNRLHELPPNPIVRHEHMLNELSAMIGAKSAVSALLDMRSGEKPELLFLVYHGFDELDRQSKVYEFVRGMEDSIPSSAGLMRLLALPPQATRTGLGMKQIGHDMPRAIHVPRSSRAPLQMGDSIASLLELPRAEATSAMSFHRGRYNRQPFSQRDRRLVELFHSQIEWMFDEQLPGETKGAVGTLTPRQQQTLRCLLSGDSEKQIAHKLCRSQHTVHTYVKGIYRNLGVSSRGELLSLFVR